MSHQGRGLRGASPDAVGRALREGTPLPGRDAEDPVRGFAGELPDGRLVRDVLGREALFVDGDEWAFDPESLDDPELLPAGSVKTGGTVERAWTLSNPEPDTDPDLDPGPETASGERESIRGVTGALEAALADVPDVPVAFSGGVDSALVAAATDGPLYVVGFPESDDVAAARDAAPSFDGDLRVVEVDHETLERCVPEVARATGRTNAMDVSIAVPLYLAAERAAADGFDRLAVGQGADELFGGYAKVANAPEDPRVEADTVRGARREVLRTLPRQVPRDLLAMRAAGVEPVAPLLDDRVVAAALPLPGTSLVDEDGTRKVALREAARSVVPARVADREKNAVQYGSDVSRELDRLARQNGFKRRMGNHVQQYVESLLGT